MVAVRRAVENNIKMPDREWYSWYQSFDKTHTQQQRQEWYSEAAKAYRWARPRYPQSLIDRVFEQANLTPHSQLLELGCGPGIATADFAAKQIAIQAVEPSAAACELARQSCKSYEKVTVHNSTFEDWSLPEQKFDAVLAATSFHWISPDVACRKSAAALNPSGSLILLWATPPQPNEEILQHSQPVYEQFDLAKIGKEQHRTQTYYQHNFNTYAEIVGSSDWFENAAVDTCTQHSPYSIEKYIALLSTLSSYITLDSQTRANLFLALRDRLTNLLLSPTAEIETAHYFASQVAPLKPVA